MKLDSHQKWDTRIKILGFFLTCVSILIGIWTFSSQQRTNIKLAHDLQVSGDSIQFSRKVWERQSDLCSQLVTLASKISVNASDKKEFEKNAKDFDEKYWGSRILLTDSGVNDALIRFHIEIIDFREEIGSVDKLKIRTDSLSNACRRFLLRK